MVAPLVPWVRICENVLIIKRAEEKMFREVHAEKEKKNFLSSFF
jgi:hypothetical protein